MREILVEFRGFPPERTGSLCAAVSSEIDSRPALKGCPFVVACLAGHSIRREGENWRWFPLVWVNFGRTRRRVRREVLAMLRELGHENIFIGPRMKPASSRRRFAPRTDGQGLGLIAGVIIAALAIGELLSMIPGLPSLPLF